MGKALLEKDIVRGICHDKSFMPLLVESGIQGRDFDKEPLAWIVDNSINYYNEYGKRPTRKVLKRLIEKDSELEEKEAKLYLRAVRDSFKKVPDSHEFSLKELGKFSRKQKFVKRLERSAELVDENEDVDKIIDRFSSDLLSIAAKREREWIAVDLLDDYEYRQKIRRFRKEHPEKYNSFHFGIKKIDRIARRGLTPGDVGSIAAKTGRGKSIFTIQVGLQGLFQSFGTTHITTENKLDQTKGRYDSRITGVPYDQIQMFDFDGDKRSLLRQMQQTIDMLRDNFTKKLKVVECVPNKTSILTIMDVVDELERKEGHKTELLIVDSPELMIPTTHYKDFRLQKAAVYWELKSFCMERNIIGFITSQLTRGSDDSMPTAEDMSEAYDKARLLDLMFALVRTIKHMLTDEALLWIVKARDFENTGQPIELNTDYSCMFVDV